MKFKRLAALTLGLLLATQFIALPVAFAEESTPSKPSENKDGSLTLVQTYPADEEAPILPETITQGGQSYTLQNTTTETDTTYAPPTKTFTTTAFSEVPLEGINNLGAYFPAVYPISEGEYQGEIGLDPLNPYTVVERYETFKTQVDRYTEFYDLPDNDVTRIPTSQTFEVSSSAYPGATTTSELQILGVSYSVAGADHLGLPNNYTAHVTYRGQEEYLELHHYDVTANYTGELVSNEEQMALTGTYQAVAATPTPVPVTTEISNPETPLAEPEFPIIPLAITSAVIAVFVAAPLLLFFFLSNARLIRVTETADKVGKRKETTESICRRRLVLKEGVAEFRIPPQVDIFNGDTYYLVIKPHVADRDGEVLMSWQGRTVAMLPLARHTDVNFKEMLEESTEAVLTQMEALSES